MCSPPVLNVAGQVAKPGNFRRNKQDETGCGYHAANQHFAYSLAQTGYACPIEMHGRRSAFRAEIRNKLSNEVSPFAPAEVAGTRVHYKDHARGQLIRPDVHLLSDRSADPDVERLLEGFAFLSGQIRQKIADAQQA